MSSRQDVRARDPVTVTVTVAVSAAGNASAAVVTVVVVAVTHLLHAGSPLTVAEVGLTYGP